MGEPPMSNRIRLALGVAAAALLASPVVAQDDAPTEITCEWPVRSGDTAETVRERFGDQARSEVLLGGEGYEFEGMFLWPDDPARRVEVLFEEDNPDLLVSGLRLLDDAAWPVAGVRLGDPLEQVREANGAPFEFWGFGWDYGGYVATLDEGRFVSLAGGCELLMRFSPDDDVDLPDALVGEVKVSTEDPRVKATKARVSQLVVSYDLGDGAGTDTD